MAQKSYKAVIFDMDDTLIKTYAVKLRQHQHFAREVHGFDINEEEFFSHWGKPFDVFLASVYAQVGGDIEMLKEKYLQYSHLFPVELHDDTTWVLDHLHGLGKKLGIVTATSREVVMRDLTLAGFPFEKLHKLQTSSDTAVHKPDPRVFDPMLASLADVGITDDILYVGDALMDHAAATGAGLHFIGVTTGAVSEQQFRDAGAEHVIDCLGKLPALVK
jgi:HAD superfamily hydrolase (TIGR01549 family)